MKFCSICKSMMVKTTMASGEIMFVCRCSNTVMGGPEDTLMHEESFNTTGNQIRHDDLIANSPFDRAGRVVLLDCPQCNLNFMYMIRVGSNATTMYTCSCGYQASHAQHTAAAQNMNKAAPGEQH